MFGNYLFLVNLTDRPLGSREPTIETAVFQTPDAIRFYLLQLCYSLQTGECFKGFTEPPVRWKNHADGSKIRRCLQKTVMGWKNGNERENKNHWLSKRIVCIRSNQQPWRGGNPQIRGEPPLVICHGQWRPSNPPSSHMLYIDVLLFS